MAVKAKLMLKGKRALDLFQLGKFQKLFLN